MCQPGGCTRCCLQAPSICCDMHCPDVLARLFGPPPQSEGQHSQLPPRPVSPGPILPGPISTPNTTTLHSSDASTMSHPQQTTPVPTQRSTEALMHQNHPSPQQNPTINAPSHNGQQAKTRIGSFTATDKDIELRRALHLWRKEATVNAHGRAVLRDIGTALVLPNQILERIVGCAHYGVLRTVEDLRREVQWSRVDEFGEQVIGVIKRINHRPLTIQPPSSVGSQREPLGSNNRAVNVSAANIVSPVSWETHIF